jgi:hypothetical protein
LPNLENRKERKDEMDKHTQDALTSIIGRHFSSKEIIIGRHSENIILEIYGWEIDLPVSWM